jgi:hypothetical protein
MSLNDFIVLLEDSLCEYRIDCFNIRSVNNIRYYVMSLFVSLVKQRSNCKTMTRKSISPMDFIFKYLHLYRITIINRSYSLVTQLSLTFSLNSVEFSLPKTININHIEHNFHIDQMKY